MTELPRSEKIEFIRRELSAWMFEHPTGSAGEQDVLIALAFLTELEKEKGIN